MKVKQVDRNNVSRGRKNSIILVLGTLIAIGPFSIDAYLPAFKQIAGDFKVDTSAIGFTLTTYFVGIGLGQLAYGPLMDRYGRRKPLIAGLILYIVTSLLSAFAWDVMSLAVLRFFTAIGACAGMVASKAIVRDLFDEEKVAEVLSTPNAYHGNCSCYRTYHRWLYNRTLSLANGLLWSSRFCRIDVV